MKNNSNETYILNIIRYLPIILVLILCLFISAFIIKEKKDLLKEEIKNHKSEFLQKNKTKIKKDVNRIYSRILIDKKEELDIAKKLIRREIIQAYSIIENIYNTNIKKENYSKQETLEDIKTALRNIKFLGGNGYLFVYEIDGLNILNSEFPSIEGKNLWNYKDSKGTLLLQEMKKILNVKNETFYSWYWKKPSNKTKEFEKLGFFKKFEPYNIFVGSGVYIRDIEEKIKTDIINRINLTKFGEKEHLFIFDENGSSIVNSKKEYIGKNLYNKQNKDGEFIVQEFISFAKKYKEGFKSYSSIIDLNNKLLIENSEISYLKLFEDWGWIIGSGFYLKKLNEDIKNKELILIKETNEYIKNTIIIATFTAVIFVLLSFYLSKQLENKFRIYKKRLEEEIINSYEKERLLIQQSKMATMGEMIGSIAHQWKQPLNILSLSNGIVKISRTPQDIFTEKEVDDAIENIDFAIKNLNQTIEDFRNFFNPNKEKNHFKISTAIEETIKLIIPQLRNNNIEIVKNIDDVKIYSSQNELQQVLINLIKNAKEELCKKGFQLNRYIFIDVKKIDNKVQIQIKDNAQGIKKDIIEKVFDAYFTTKEESGGTGIGLYMSKQIIEEHMNGKLEVKNQNYEYKNEKYYGALFTITLPI